MAAPHNQNNLQQQVAYGANGVNGDDHDQNDTQQNVVRGVNGGDELPQEQPQPLSSDEPWPELEQRVLDMELGMGFEDDPQPNFKEVLFRGVYVCRRLIACLADRFVGQPLNQAAYAAVTSGMTVAQQATERIHAAACQHQTMTWYMTAPLSVYKFVVSTCVELAEKYLDLAVPENQSAVNWFRLLNMKMDDLVEYLSSSPVPLLDEEEPSEQEPPETCGMFFTVSLVELATGEEEETQDGIEKEGEKREKMEEKAQQEKGEDHRPESAAGEEAKSAEHAEAPAPPDNLPSASEVRPATMGVDPQEQPQTLPSAQPKSSKDLAAQDSSEEAPSPSKSAEVESHGAKEKSLPPVHETQTSATSGAPHPQQSPQPTSSEDPVAKGSSEHKRRPRKRAQRENHRDKKAKLLWKVFGSQLD